MSLNRIYLPYTYTYLYGLITCFCYIHYREIVGPNKVLQGNMDPCVLYASKEDISVKVKQMIQRFGCKHHIANLGQCSGSGNSDDDDGDDINIVLS